MSPAGIAFLGVGTFFQSAADAKKGYAEAEAEFANAAFYREQAKFARTAGDRKVAIFDRESKVLYGDQASAFAKAGVDTGESSDYIAREAFFRGQERSDIYAEADLNVRLAQMRADASEKQGQARGDSVKYEVLGNYLNFGANAYGGS